MGVAPAAAGQNGNQDGSAQAVGKIFGIFHRTVIAATASHRAGAVRLVYNGLFGGVGKRVPCLKRRVNVRRRLLHRLDGSVNDFVDDGLHVFGQRLHGIVGRVHSVTQLRL